MSTARNSVMVAGLITVAAVAYWPSTVALWTIWMDPDLGDGRSHGLLVGLLSLWMLFRMRRVIATARVRPALWAYPLLLMCSAASLVFWRAGIESAQLAMLPALAVLAACAAFGTEVARAILVPIGFLYFGMPGWGILEPFLQTLTIRAVAVLGPLLQLPLYVSGSVVNLHGVGQFEISQACSGVNFLVVGLAVAALIGELGQFPIRRRIELLVVMGVVAIGSNWLRALLIIAVGYASNMRLVLATRAHLLFGWVIFATILLGYVWWATRKGTMAATPEPTTVVTLSRPRGFVGYLTAVLGLGILPTCVYTTVASPVASTSVAQLAAPPGRAGWHGPLPVADVLWQPVFVGTHAERRFAYEDSAAHRVEVLEIGYSRQQQGSELVNEENSLLGDRGFTTVHEDTITSGRRQLREFVTMDDSGDRSLIWSLYDIGGRTFSKPIYSQLWYGVQALRHAPYSELLAFRATCQSSCAQARTVLHRFLETFGVDFYASTAAVSRIGKFRSPA